MVCILFRYMITLNGGSRADRVMAGLLLQNGGSRTTSAIVWRKVVLNGGSKLEELHCKRNTFSRHIRTVEHAQLLYNSGHPAVGICIRTSFL